MNNEIKILKLLLNTKEKKFTIRQISENLEINYRIAYEKSLKLEKEDLNCNKEKEHRGLKAEKFKLELEQSWYINTIKLIEYEKTNRDRD
jgi:hypothetical protein